MMDAETLAKYEALTRSAGLVSLGQRTQIEVLGRDRATFLHNLCTNDVRKLTVGQGCEAFFTNVQGKVLAHVYIWAGEESLILETVPGQSKKLLTHLDRYLIREDVQLVDRTQQWTEFLLSGANVSELLTRWKIAIDGIGHCTAAIGGHTISVRKTEITQPASFLLSCSVEHAHSMDEIEVFCDIPCDLPALEIARIEAGFPWHGVDISEENLAPEVGRDRQAISYVKGCYLGQETIARIDALGHVNRLLVGVAFETAEIPPAGCELSRDGKVVGHVTSAVFSPALQTALALAYMRRGHNELGMHVSSSLGPAKVVALPLR